MKLVFMGSSEFAVASLGALLHSPHRVELVVAQPDKPAGRGQKMTPCAVAEFARENKLPLAQPSSLKDNARFLEQLRFIAPDAIVVAAYGKILPMEILRLPPKGCINVHASLLPKYRGAAPINWAVMNGESSTGVTTMFMNEHMDEGDILLQCKADIMPHETAGDLHDHLAAIGAELLTRTLDEVENKGLKGIPQDASKATYAPKLKKEDGIIDWKLSSAGIHHRILGLQPWPRAWTRLNNDILFIYDAAPVEFDSKEAPGTVTSLDKGIFVQTGLGQLCILELQMAGKRRMPAVEFVKGYKLKAGDKFL
jgi:methionyl-tRNA formyltransferase